MLHWDLWIPAEVKSRVGIAVSIFSSEGRERLLLRFSDALSGGGAEMVKPKEISALFHGQRLFPVLTTERNRLNLRNASQPHLLSPFSSSFHIEGLSGLPTSDRPAGAVLMVS